MYDGDWKNLRNAEKFKMNIHNHSNYLDIAAITICSAMAF